MRRNCWDISRTASLALSVFLLSFLSAAGQERGIVSSLDTNRIRIGEQATLEIRVTASKSEKVSFPSPEELKKELSGNMEAVSFGKWDTLLKRNRAEYTRKLTLTSFDSGAYHIPAIAIVVGGDTLRTDSYELTVDNVPVDTLKQPRYGIKYIQDVPYTFGEVARKWWWIPVGLIALAALGWFIYRIVKNRKQKLSPEMLLSPYERAKYRLQHLDDKGLLQEGHVKEYYIGMTDVVRRYLQEEYSIPAMEKTSDEILKSIRELKLGKDEYRQFQDLLTDSDFVKFAKFVPSNAENEKYRKVTEDIIDALRPAPAENEEKDHDGNDL